MWWADIGLTSYARRTVLCPVFWHLTLVCAQHVCHFDLTQVRESSSMGSWWVSITSSIDWRSQLFDKTTCWCVKRDICDGVCTFVRFERHRGYLTGFESLTEVRCTASHRRRMKNLTWPRETGHSEVYQRWYDRSQKPGLTTQVRRWTRVPTNISDDFGRFSDVDRRHRIHHV